MERDAKTDAELAGLGWKVLRFWSRDVLKKTEQCLKIIEESVEESKSDTARQKVDQTVSAECQGPPVRRE